MALWKTSFKVSKFNQSSYAKKLHGLELPWEGDVNAFLGEREVGNTDFDSSLGTIGGGNHFAELQVVFILDHRLL